MSENDDIHVVPRGDVIEHEESESCICEPVWDAINKKEYKSGLATRKLFVHKRIKETLQ